jgi:hypothetical protein
MSNQLTCKDPFAYKPGLEDGNASGPSPVSNADLMSWSSSSGVVRFSKTITIDSVFASFVLNQQGGNYTTNGYLYEIWLDGFVNNDPVEGNIINGGHWIFVFNSLTLDVYDLVVVDTQDVTDPVEGNVTKVLVADPSYSNELSAYVDAIQEGDESYFISGTPLEEHATPAVFGLDNDITRRINLTSRNLSQLISAPLLPSSTNGSLWIDAPESVLSYPQFSVGNSLRLQRLDNRESGFEVVIDGTPTYRGQASDEATGQVNLGLLTVGTKIALLVNLPTEKQYNKGDSVYVSPGIIDVRSGNYGIEYVRATVLSFSAGVLEMMVTFRPNGASSSGNNWYVISEVDQINIPISSNHYFSLLDPGEIPGYELLNGVFSVRLQIEDNRRFNRYVFRYKPNNSSSWKYVNASSGSTIIQNVIPNTVFDEEVMGFNDSTGECCGFSQTGTFNTFF